MGLGVVEKIIKEHLLKGKMISGEEITLKIDQTLTQDATGTMAYLQFEALEIQKIKTELSVSYVDHNTIQDSFENADDHCYLQTAASKYGAYFSRAGNGICHQVHLERFAEPGKTLLGSDSHTPTAGGMGMLAIGAGGLDVAVAMGTCEYTLRYPRIIRINLEGKLNPWINAKDIILTILKMFGTKGNVGTIIEYGGSGLKSLDVPERATITNMGAELGVTTSAFPSDFLTKRFLAAENRESAWKELKADSDAKYKKVINIDLAEIEPMLACPHSPGNVVPVRELAGKRVDQVIIGSCTNSSYNDLKTVAHIVKGHKIPQNVSFVVAPGSRQVLKMITDDGSLSTLIDAGARIAECVCGFCIGNSHAPATGAVSIRTSNRNFKGRSGTQSASVYLSSPQTAAACALSGIITDPRDLKELVFPSFDLPKKFHIDDTMIIHPAPEGKKTKIHKGPNIGDPPKNKPLSENINAKIAIKVGDEITTDHIMPAGSRLKYRSNIKKYSQFVFEEIDPSFTSRCKDNKLDGYSNIIVAGLSYGQGSSREHAAMCPMHLEVKAVIAKSIERIHRTNLINFGILPLIFIKPDYYKHLNAGDIVEIRSIEKIITKNAKLVLKNKTKNVDIELKYDFTEKEKQIIVAGGLLNYIKRKDKQ
ncbi:aconitate hydratase [bacterium]|nr:aconitate hydratase [bacterium]